MPNDSVAALPPLNSLQLEVINWIEQYWHREGLFPSLNKLKSRFPSFDPVESFRHATFKFALHNRGVEVPVEISLIDDDGVTTKTELTTEQAVAIIAVTNFEDKRSRRSKLSEMGISLQQWNGWMKDPQFKLFLQEVSLNNFHDSIHVAHEGLLRSVEKGDTNAIKYYMEITGRHTEANVGNQNIRVMLARLTEVLQRHVSPEQLALIGQDFQTVMRNDKLEEPPRMLEGSI